jgi:uncharacterized protein (TIGR01777 family)
MRLTYRAEIADHAPETVFDWHERSGALQRLTPPWADVDFVESSGGIRDGGRVSLRIRRGPTTFRWELRHSDYEYGRQFRDEQTSGPLKSWTHVHRFSPNGLGGTIVEDEVEVEPPLGVAGAAIAPSIVKAELGRLFRFRYRRLFTDLARHAEHRDRPRLTVAITGPSGMIGTNLRHFLTTGGHDVIRLVRDSRELDDGAIFWNPATGDIDRDGLARADAVVNLAGSSIAAGRWTEARKKSIKQSRVRSTELMSRTLAELGPDGPRTLVSMSAIGYYGNRRAELVDETARPGRGFLAEVCRAWEGATRPAERAGIRVVTLRGGLALSPEGGPLGQMLLPFKMGVGGRLGSGKQYLSWIDLDDLIAVIYHVLHTPSLSGPVNATAPHPVTNATFTSALGRALGRPTVLPVPALAVKAAFGELGTEALLWGQRVVPKKLLDSGFEFFYEGVEESLRFQLGRED